MSISTVSGQKNDDFGTKFFKGLAIAAGLVIVAKIAKDAIEHNQVQEECAKGAVPCINSLSNTGREFAGRAGPIALACLTPPIAPAVCFSTIGAQAFR